MVAGNDSHQNVGFVVKGTQDGKYQLEDALGEKVAILDPQKMPALTLLFGPPTPGKELYRRQLDPYASSLGYVSTHILAPERTEKALRKSLHEAGSYRVEASLTIAGEPRAWIYTSVLRVMPP